MGGRGTRKGQQVARDGGFQTRQTVPLQEGESPMVRIRTQHRALGARGREDGQRGSVRSAGEGTPAVVAHSGAWQGSDKHF